VFEFITSIVDFRTYVYFAILSEVSSKPFCGRLAVLTGLHPSIIRDRVSMTLDLNMRKYSWIWCKL